MNEDSLTIIIGRSLLVDTATFWTIVGGMATAIVALVIYIRSLHIEHKADLKESNRESVKVIERNTIVCDNSNRLTEKVITLLDKDITLTIRDAIRGHSK